MFSLQIIAALIKSDYMTKVKPFNFVNSAIFILLGSSIYYVCTDGKGLDLGDVACGEGVSTECVCMRKFINSLVTIQKAAQGRRLVTGEGYENMPLMCM